MLLRIIISNNNNILFKCGSIQVEKKETWNAITTLAQPPLVLRYLIVFFQIKISVNPKFFYISLMFVGSMTIYKQVPFKFSFVMKKRFIWIENDHPRIFLLFSCDKLWFPCKYWRYKFLSALNMASKTFRIITVIWVIHIQNFAYMWIITLPVAKHMIDYLIQIHDMWNEKNIPRKIPNIHIYAYLSHMRCSTIKSCGV